MLLIHASVSSAAATRIEPPTHKSVCKEPLAHTGCTSSKMRCRFQFGAFFHKDSTVKGADYLTVWLGTHSKAYGFRFNPHWHGRMLEHVLANNQTAVYYAYVRRPCPCQLHTHHCSADMLELLSLFLRLLAFSSPLWSVSRVLIGIGTPSSPLEA